MPWVLAIAHKIKFLWISLKLYEAPHEELYNSGDDSLDYLRDETIVSTIKQKNYHCKQADQPLLQY